MATAEHGDGVPARHDAAADAQHDQPPPADRSARQAWHACVRGRGDGGDGRARRGGRGRPGRRGGAAAARSPGRRSSRPPTKPEHRLHVAPATASAGRTAAGPRPGAGRRRCASASSPGRAQGVPDRAALADEVGGHQRLAVPRRQGVGRPEARGQEQQQPEAVLASRAAASAGCRRPRRRSAAVLGRAASAAGCGAPAAASAGSSNVGRRRAQPVASSPGLQVGRRPGLERLVRLASVVSDSTPAARGQRQAGSGPASSS